MIKDALDKRSVVNLLKSHYYTNLYIPSTIIFKKKLDQTAKLEAKK